MEHLKGPLYLDIAAKGLSLAGIGLMFFGQGDWFAAGILLVFIGVLIGTWAMVTARRVRAPSGPARPAPFGGWSQRNGAAEGDGNSRTW